MLFVLSLGHFCMMSAISYDWDADAVRLRGSNANTFSASNVPLLKNSFFEILYQPSLLLTPGNRHYCMWLADTVMTFVIPGLLSLMFLNDMTDASSTLVPLIKLYEDDPQFINQHLQDSVAVCEPLLRTILDKNLETLGELESSEEACQVIRDAALKESGTDIGDNTADIEIAATFGRKASNLAEPLTTLDFIVDTWWPLHFILKRDQSEGNSFSFAWRLHCLLCGVVLGIDLIQRIERMTLFTEDTIRTGSLGDWKMGGSTMIPWAVLTVAQIIIGVRVMTILIWTARGITPPDMSTVLARLLPKKFTI